MHIVLTDKTFDINNIIFGVKSNNNIIKYGHFYRMFYSDEYHTVYGVSIFFDLTNINTEVHYNKLKCNFMDNSNQHILSKMIYIEKKILQKCSHLNKTPSYQIHDQIVNKYIKIFNDHSLKQRMHKKIKFILKISGIWESKNEYGLTFKFINVQ